MSEFKTETQYTITAEDFMRLLSSAEFVVHQCTVFGCDETFVKPYVDQLAKAIWNIRDKKKEVVIRT